MNLTEEPMKTRSIALAVLCGAALASSHAAACRIEKTPWGVRYSGCQLRDLYGGRFDMLLEKWDPPYTVALPNLLIVDIDAVPVAGGVNVNMSAEFENNGNRNATRAFEITLVVSVHDPLNKGFIVGSPVPLPAVQVPSLNTGASASAFFGTVALPNRTQDWDVCSIGVIDPPLPNNAFGALLEANEGDNRRDSCTRIFGTP